MQNTSYRAIILKALLGSKRVTTIGIWQDPRSYNIFRLGLATTMEEANRILPPDRQYESITLVVIKNIPDHTFIIEYEDGTQDTYREKPTPAHKQKYMVGAMANA